MNDGLSDLENIVGYYQMVQFMGDPHNHSTLDTNDLEIHEKNDKERTPLMLCFTPPSATVSLCLAVCTTCLLLCCYSGVD